MTGLSKIARCTMGCPSMPETRAHPLTQVRRHISASQPFIGAFCSNASIRDRSEQQISWVPASFVNIRSINEALPALRLLFLSSEYCHMNSFVLACCRASVEGSCRHLAHYLLAGPSIFRLATTLLADALSLGLSRPRPADLVAGVRKWRSCDRLGSDGACATVGTGRLTLDSR